MGQFIDELRGLTELSKPEESVIRSMRIRSFDHLLSVTSHFPSLSRIGVNIPKLGSIAVQRASSGMKVAANQSHGGKAPKMALGAKPPKGITVGRSASVPLTTKPGSGGSPPVQPPLVSVDVSPPTWPIRDQGDRGTCVAFAVAACREHLAFPTRQPTDLDLAEQYLYWAIKKKIMDPWPDEEGTLLSYGSSAMEVCGTCEKKFWPYSKIPIKDNISQHTSSDPCKAAHADADNWKQTARFYRSSVRTNIGAQDVLHVLSSGRPVAVSVPVFVDLLKPDNNNWNSPISVLTGMVEDPVPTSFPKEGHAICITGFEPDPDDLNRGWFVFRNSWGASWATSPGLSNPAILPNRPQGYGFISADHVDNYLWELFAL